MPPSPASASYLSVVLPIADRDAPSYVKILVPLFSRCADLLLDPSRNWVWEVYLCNAYDMNVPAEERECPKNSLRYLSDYRYFSRSDPVVPKCPAETDPQSDILYTMDFRSLPI